MAASKELQEMVAFVCVFGNAVGKSLEDGKLSIGDAANFFSVLGAGSRAIDGWPQALAELQDLDEGEAKALVNQFKVQFNISDDKIEARIENGFDILERVFYFYKLLKRYI